MGDQAKVRLDANSPDRAAWDDIREALRGLRFGTVTLIVHDGVVIQVERTEKKRLQPGHRRR